MNDWQNILKEIKQSVISIDENAEVILFGSRARRDYNEESDWDVLVLIDKEQSDWRFKQKRETGNIYNTLFNYRSDGDYGDFLTYYRKN